MISQYEWSHESLLLQIKIPIAARLFWAIHYNIWYLLCIDMAVLQQHKGLALHINAPFYVWVNLESAAESKGGVIRVKRQICHTLHILHIQSKDLQADNIYTCRPLRLALWDCNPAEDGWSCAYTVHSILLQIQSFLIDKDSTWQTSQVSCWLPRSEPDSFSNLLAILVVHWYHACIL